MIYHYRFWKEWIDEQGRLWAEPCDYDNASDARRIHTAAMGWVWAEGKLRPSVSDLYSVAFKEDPVTGKKREENRTTIQDGATRGFHEATLSGLRPTDQRNTMPPTFTTARTPAKPDRYDTPF